MPTEMKLKPGNQLTLTEAGDFNYQPRTDDANKAELYFKNPNCSKRKGQVCTILICLGAPQEPFHGWDGNLEKPTVTPSIGCESRGCVFHGHIIKGLIHP